MKLKDRIRGLGDRLVQPQKKKSLSLYLMIFLPIALNSFITLALVKSWSNTEIKLDASQIELDRENTNSSPLSNLNGYEQGSLLSLKWLSFLIIILTAIPTSVWLAFVIEKLSDSLPSAEEHRQLKESGSEQKQNLVTGTAQNVQGEPYALLAKMSHELRSPLNAILGFAQIMEQELSSDRDGKKNIEIIHNSGEQLLSIINDLVDFAKIETSRLSLENNDIDFHSWLDLQQKSFEFLANSQGGKFSMIRQPNLPQYICVDNRRIRQILQNLVNYCLSQSTPSPEVRICVDSKSSDRQQSNEESNYVEQQEISFKVVNVNCSASANELGTLFDPLVRVESEQKHITGSSLNLPLSQKLARLAGGDLTVYTDSDAESNLIFQLKIVAAIATTGRAEVQSVYRRVIGLESSQTKYRILVVDDSKVNRMIMLQLLESVGFKVQEAVNGKEAVDIWFRWQPHMIWMDLKMPVMNGYEATELIKSYSQTLYTPIVALSASTLEEEKSQLSAAGCDDFVGKPFSEGIIFEKIAQHLGIRYVYEPIQSDDAEDFCLTADTLKVMPEKWLEQVEGAATVLDRHLLNQLLQEIPSEHADLKNALQQQIDNFEFDLVLDLVKSNTHSSNT